MQNYYTELNSLVKRLEVNKRTRYLQENSDILNTYWNIGKLIVEAQGGETRAKYGNELIKKWAKDLTEAYGKGYDISNLKRFRQFYLTFAKGGTVCHQLTWSHIRTILTINDENKRNYYINLSLERSLSVRELKNEIKSYAYERLLNKPEKIEIKQNKKDKYDIQEEIRNPIVIKLDENDKILKEKELQLKILSKLKQFFSELGRGFALIGNEYKITIENKSFYIDLLLFNVEMNCYVVVELKLRELKKEDKAQIEFYMKCVDKTLKRDFHNKTIGILVTKKQNQLIFEFVKSSEIIPLTYELSNIG